LKKLRVLKGFLKEKSIYSKPADNSIIIDVLIMKKFIFCEYLKENGYCKKTKKIMNLDDPDGAVFESPRKCLYGVNDLSLIALKKANHYALVMNKCSLFEPVEGLEKMLEVLGTLEFDKKTFFMLEEDELYIIIRHYPKIERLKIRGKKRRDK